jgi:hypothetical protein
VLLKILVFWDVTQYRLAELCSENQSSLVFSVKKYSKLPDPEEGAKILHYICTN